MRPYVDHVLARRGRWRADLPGAFAILFWIAFACGLKPDIYGDLNLYVWLCAALGVGCAVLWRIGHRALRWTLTVDERGIRLANRAGAVIDLGHPSAVRHGKGSVLVTAGRAARTTGLLWVAVDVGGEPTVFQRAMGVLDAMPRDWPAGDPPRTPHVYSSLGFDPVRFYAAAREQVRAA